MDIPLTKPRNTRWTKCRRLLLMGSGLCALVFGIGALPVAFLYFAGESQRPPAESQLSSEPRQLEAKRKQVVAFVNVNVVPMDSERLLTAQTVIVRDGLIEKLDDAGNVRVPSGALRIDGRGKYLMPGLADMHVHFEVFNDRVNATMMKLFVANGVTSVLNLFGVPGFLELRDRVAKGELVGPAIYTSGPFISNSPAPPPTPEEVEVAVIAQKKAGYDVIKIHGDFSREAYRKLFEVSRREGMTVIGHLPRNLGVEAAIEEKQDAIAHAEEYLYAYFSFKPPTSPADPSQAARLKWIADQSSRIQSISEATAKAGIWVSPTLTVYRGIGFQVNDIDAYFVNRLVQVTP